MPQPKIIQLTDYNCPVCNIQEEHDDLNQALFFCRKSYSTLIKQLEASGYFFSPKELKDHRTHLRVEQEVDKKWAEEEKLLRIDIDRIKKLPTMNSLDIIETKIKTVRAILNELETAGVRTAPEYNVFIRRLTELVELKEKIQGKFNDKAVVIDLSQLKHKLESDA